jgi:hypothetical protein
MNGYELSRAFWDYAFEHPEKIRPIHSAIFFFAIEHCNRLGWKVKFGFPTTMAMDAIGVKSYNTYTRALSELVDYGFIEMIQQSKNQYSANIIALSKNDEALDKALDKALIKHGTKQSESNYQSTVSIDKQYNNKQINHSYSENEFLEDWAKCRKSFRNLPTNIKGLKTHDSLNFSKAVKDYSKEEIREAMRGLFMQEQINFTSMITQPTHFLERVEMYLNAFQSKDFKMYGTKPVEH